MTTVTALADGAPVLIRPLLRSDRAALADGFERLSPEARRLRFFMSTDRLSDRELDYLTDLDYLNHFAWAAFAIDQPGRPGIGVARYVRDPDNGTRAEAAVTVVDTYQRRGLGTLLLAMLVEVALSHGIRTFTAHVLWENDMVIEPLRALGARVVPDEPGVARVEIDLPDALGEVERALLSHALSTVRGRLPTVEAGAATRVAPR